MHPFIRRATMSTNRPAAMAYIRTLGVFLVSVAAAVAHAQVPSESAMPSNQEAADPAAAKPASLDKLLDMADKDVSQLSQVKVGATGSPSLDTPVSTVARQESTVGHSAAAIFVITNEMIRRSGAKEIPEVLRMAPGVEVAQIEADKWAVSIRGFNGLYANKLLVRIDGRDVYTPLFAGTFWDVQDVLLEDVDRIEVIRGPGASIWGANAVDGVINIITKNSKETQGVYAETGGGTFERQFTSARYGGRLGEDATYRLYGKWFDRGPDFDPNGPANDAWNQGRGGFRMDWNASSDDAVTFQGDYYNVYSGEQGFFPAPAPPYTTPYTDIAHVSGENAIVCWKRTIDEKSDWTTKVYYDRTERHWPASEFAEDRNTVDFDLQYRFPAGERQEMICGLEYRNTSDSIFSDPPIFGYVPAQRSDDLYSCFAQDEITLSEDRWFFDPRVEVRAQQLHGLRIPTDGPTVVDTRQEAFSVGRRIACGSHAVACRKRPRRGWLPDWHDPRSRVCAVFPWNIGTRFPVLYGRSQLALRGDDCV
jgi:iron complex outermembrane recepter protein